VEPTSTAAAAIEPQNGAEPLIVLPRTAPKMTATRTSKALYLPSMRLSATRTITNHSTKTTTARSDICPVVRSFMRAVDPKARSMAEMNWSIACLLQRYSAA
jgi:hypothetical protein